MRLIKMFGLAAVAAVAAMAFIGATSASALNTQLCTAHTALTCGAGNGATTVSMLGTGRLLASVDVICDHVVGVGTPLALANPQQLHILELSFLSCETDEFDACEVTVTELPLMNLNKTGLDLGTLTGTNGKTFVFCEDVFFSADLECEYDATGLQFAVGAQMLTATETPVNEIGSDFLCPNEPTVDALLNTLGGNKYVLA